MVIRLRAADRHLELGESSPGWVQVWLVSQDVRTYLGADARHVVVDRLLAALSAQRSERAGESEAAGEIEGRPVTWAMTLSEAHASLYTAVDGETRLLVWQDANGGQLATMRLTAEQAEEWRRQLQGAPR